MFYKAWIPLTKVSPRKKVLTGANHGSRLQFLNTFACTGPLELCARQKKVVHKDSMIVAQREVWDFQGGKVPLGEMAHRMTAGLATAISTSSSSSSPPPTSRPIAVKAGVSRAVPSSVETREATDAADLNGSHPRSLPETSGVLARQTSADGPSISSGVPVPATAAAAVDPRPPYGSSLGIEVLETLDRAARQTRRPTFSKAISGFDIARGSNEGASRSASRSNRANGRGWRSRRPRGHGRSSSEAAFSETSLEQDLLSETDEEEEEGQGGSETISSDRMSSSDYFAYGTSGRRREALPSIQGTLEEGENAVHKGTAASQAHEQAAAVGTSGPPDPRPTRRRMRSVGQWSIGSIGSWGSLNGTTPAGGSTPPAAAAGGPGVNSMEDADRPIKVIVERLVDDRSLPWQAWLRA